MHTSEEKLPFEEFSSKQSSVELDALDSTGSAFVMMLSAAMLNEVEWGSNIIQPLVFSGHRSFAFAGLIVLVLIILSMGWLLFIVQG
eukprot:CAMPEP_0172924276 /NCGR_PEP_ID=MMETSP1075-20121228/211399_1 /TAXON_ID=2916 /ORGANISM="Ceratium fusus, Strain PA161109" /LENGTH=86 /DNA_ID=CAMNT_0013784903 /DNA_START=148 /DNA_END=404 /DNA_ORIENTATION=+